MEQKRIKKTITPSQYGTRHNRKLKRYSDNFYIMFSFFLKVYRSGLITFCGSNVETFGNPNEIPGTECFRRYDDGVYSKGKEIFTRHPNIARAVIIGKKGWGLWRKQWCEGIREGSFTKYEILSQFEEKNIKIPEVLLNEFYDFLYK